MRHHVRHFEEILNIMIPANDLLDRYKEQLCWSELSAIRTELFNILNRTHWDSIRDLLRQLPQASELACLVDTSSDAVTIGRANDLTEQQHETLTQIIKELIPWRKGPFELFGNYVDSEWKSNLKWDRISQVVNLRGHKVADIGCGNGYYMFRMLGMNPECVVGFDPSEKFYFVFQLIQHFLNAKSLQMELMGVEHVSLFPEFFDTALCMGVLYHQRNPLEAISTIRQSLRPKGKLIVETLTIPGDEANCLFPQNRYAKMRNVYFLPTKKALTNWLARSGFMDVEVVSEDITTIDEQRRTDFSTGESLADFLDPNDHSKTLEGYPAPQRAIVVATKNPDYRR